MSRTTRNIIDGFFPIPKNWYEPRIKVEVVDVNNATQDVSKDVLSYSVSLFDKTSLGRFTVRLNNNEGKYVGEFVHGKNINIYLNYNPTPGESFTPTTKLITGKIDNPKFMFDISQGWVVELTGRAWPQIIDKTTSLTFNNETVSNAIKAVVDDLNNLYTTAIFTYANVEDSSETITAPYLNQTHFSIIKDICNRASLSCYIDIDGDVHAFTEDSKDSLTSYAVVGVNVIGVGEYSTSGLEVKNFVTVISNQEDVDFIWTKENTTDQSSTWIKGGEYNDNSIKTITEAQEKATAIQQESETTANDRGTIVIIGDETLTPGINIPCYIPYVGINGMMRIVSITHNFDVEQGFQTVFQLNKIQKVIPNLFKNLNDDINDIKIVENPNKMKYSFIMKFDKTTNIDNFISSLPSGMSIIDGKLVMGTTSDSLTVISTTFTSPVNATQTELLINGEQISASTYQISFDNGANYQYVTPGIDNKINITNTGKQGILKINSVSNTANTNPKWESICVRWK